MDRSMVDWNKKYKIWSFTTDILRSTDLAHPQCRLLTILTFFKQGAGGTFDP